MGFFGLPLSPLETWIFVLFVAAISYAITYAIGYAAAKSIIPMIETYNDRKYCRQREDNPRESCTPHVARTLTGVCVFHGVWTLHVQVYGPSELFLDGCPVCLAEESRNATKFSAELRIPDQKPTLEGRICSLNFAREFAASVKSGEKRQTIRRRKLGGNPKPGDTLRLYTELGSKKGQKLGEVVCKSVTDFKIEFSREFVVIVLSVPGLMQEK